MSKLEKHFFHNNMVCVIKSLEKSYTVVDLRNETSIYGKIVEVDGFMNVDMVDCVYNDSLGNFYKFDSFFVKARNIRYVHLPKEMSADKLIAKQFECMMPARTKKTGLTYKQKRSTRYQQEIVKSLQ